MTQRFSFLALEIEVRTETYDIHTTRCHRPANYLERWLIAYKHKFSNFMGSIK